jgi:hypothetical protein
MDVEIDNRNALDAYRISGSRTADMWSALVDSISHSP